MTTLRDLLPQLPPNPSFQDMASGEYVEPVVDVTDYERGLVAALPGDSIESHPAYTQFASNPFRGKSPQLVLRQLKAGEITDPREQRQAQDWLRTCARFGENIFGMR